MEDIEGFSEFFLENENDHELLDGSLSKEWAHSRIKFHYSMISDMNIIDEVAFDVGELSYFDKIKYIVLCFTNLSLFKLIFSRRDVLFFSHPRSVGFDDVFSIEAMEEVSNKKSVLNVSHSEKFKFMGNRDSYCDIFRVFSKLSAIISYPFASFFMGRHKRYIRGFLDGFEQKIDAKKYEKKFCIHSIEYKFLKMFYKLMLSVNSFEEVYIVNAYYNLPLVHSARESGIMTTELQHGVISNVHIGYNALTDSSSAFCDRIGFWGEYWISVSRLPPTVNKHVVGNSKVIPRVSSIKKEKNRNKKLLVISQVSISSVLSDFFFSCLASLDGWDVIYKLHPGEFNKADEYKNKFSQISHDINLEVVTNENTLEHYISISDAQLGAYSTGIFQGLNFGLKTLIVPSSGIAYLRRLIVDGNVILCENSEDFIFALQNDVTSNHLDNDAFFRRYIGFN